jgi:hypothetical protein
MTWYKETVDAVRIARKFLKLFRPLLGELFFEPAFVGL